MSTPTIVPVETASPVGYIILQTSASLRSRGHSGRYYLFRRNEPTAIYTTQDMSAFLQSGQFVESFKNGRAKNPADLLPKDHTRPRSYTRFDPNAATRRSTEQRIEEASTLAEQERRQMLASGGLTQAEVEAGVAGYTCEKCGKPFKTAQALGSHRRSHVEDEADCGDPVEGEANPE